MAQMTTPTAEELAASGLGLAVDGAVARITLSRPRRRNAMTGRTWTMLARIGQTLPEAVRIVVVGGAGPTFSSGIDLDMFRPGDIDGEPTPLSLLADHPDDTAPLERAIAEYQEGFLWLRRADIVSVAAVRGHAIGAGFQLALSCDIRVLSDTARLCMKEPALGLVPDLTGTKPLVELVGVNRAVELCLTARTIDAEEAARLRLAEQVVADSELEPAVDELVAQLLAVPADAARATKELLLQAGRNDLETQARAERAAQLARLVAMAGAAR
ncbi:enoyl-CoA hydratase/isomerase family protein [Thermobifida halotolerans]|uniref:Enoyl-CoA hydratase/isomerase family protein n=1 Tax=Thermobifida halotolerans TaxID=483545 RepID=A0A399G770_9ACTN|nr:enoyl-CoA hydratase/isomerase family protein [Thermobifida halotolerans]UOE21660.1 enoyl-CoA hydratase/isomerase family protein [Thermobifida halotolerans]